MSEFLVNFENVSKKFCRSFKQSLWYGLIDLGGEVVGRSQAVNKKLRRDEFWALDEVSFQLKQGECLGLMGKNGAGKTTLLRILNGLIKPDKGHIEMRGSIGALIALGAGFNPILTGRENIYVNASILGLNKKEIKLKFDEIVEFAELGNFIDSAVQSYSSGMIVRLGFAIAAAIVPDILVIDEVLAVGDTKFRWKCLEKIKYLKSKGVCIILVSHNSHDLMRTCDKGLMLDSGKLSFLGDIQETVIKYEHLLYEKSTSNHKVTNDWTIEEVIFKKNNYNEVSEPSEKVCLCITINSKKELMKGRLVIGLFHSEIGFLFYTSSFRDLNWFKLEKGISKIIVQIEGFRLQFGTCRAEVSLRGERISDYYDEKQSENMLIINYPKPNYEGFGVNGGVLPNCKWEIINSDC